MAENPFAQYAPQSQKQNPFAQYAPQPAQPQYAPKDTSVALSDDPSKEYGTILPFAQSKITGKNELAFPEIIRGPVRSADTLLQAAEGKRELSPGEKGVAGLGVVSALPAASVAGRVAEAAPQMARETMRATPEMAGALAKRLDRGPVPTQESLGGNVQTATEHANALYQEATAKGGVLKPGYTNQFVQRSLNALSRPEEAEKFAGPGNPYEGLRTKLRTLQNEPLTLRGFQGIDEDLTDAIGKETAANGTVSKFGYKLQRIQDDLRKSVENASPRDIEGSQSGFQALKEGRKAWSQAMKMRDLQGVVERAGNSDNPAATLRQGIRGILNNPRKLRGYSPDEIKSLRKAMSKGSLNEVMAKIGPKFATELGAGTGALFGGLPGAAVGGATGLGMSRLGSSAATNAQMRSVQRVMDLLGGKGAKAKVSEPPSFTAGISMPPLGYRTPPSTGPAGRGASLMPTSGATSAAHPPDLSPRYTAAASLPPSGSPGALPPAGPGGPAIVPLPNGGAAVILPPPRPVRPPTPPPPGLGGAGSGGSALDFLPFGGGTIQR